MHNIYLLQELPAALAGAAGGKAATLARLRQAQYPVPDGIVLLSSCFEQEPLKNQAWNTVQELLLKLRRRRSGLAFAVRSSAASEDSGSTSYAGEFETVLNLERDEDIHQAINRVYRSRHGDRARAYSSMHGLQDNQPMAVLVQAMLPADYAGILFTADLVSGRHQYMVGSVVKGLGDKLVASLKR